MAAKAAGAAAATAAALAVLFQIGRGCVGCRREWSGSMLHQPQQTMESSNPERHEGGEGGINLGFSPAHGPLDRLVPISSNYRPRKFSEKWLVLILPPSGRRNLLVIFFCSLDGCCRQAGLSTRPSMKNSTGDALRDRMSQFLKINQETKEITPKARGTPW